MFREVLQFCTETSLWWILKIKWAPLQAQHGNNFGLQKINRKRKSFDKDKFKLAHLDLWNAHQKEIAYCEYKAIGGIDGLNYKEMS